MKKRSDNTLAPDTIKTITDKTEVNAPKSKISSEVKKVVPKRKSVTAPKKSVKAKIEDSAELQVDTVKTTHKVLSNSVGYVLNDDEQKIISAKNHDPFALLGRHLVGDKTRHIGVKTGPLLAISRFYIPIILISSKGRII